VALVQQSRAVLTGSDPRMWHSNGHEAWCGGHLEAKALPHVLHYAAQDGPGLIAYTCAGSKGAHITADRLTNGPSTTPTRPSKCCSLRSGAVCHDIKPLARSAYIE